MEDNPADARLVSLALKGFMIDHELRVVSDGMAAMDFLTKRNAYSDAPRPDVVFLDWMLPHKSGDEVLREMRFDPNLKDIPVVVVSGCESTEMIREAYNAGSNLCIVKPITLDRFPFILRFMQEILQEEGDSPPPPFTSIN